MTRIRDRFLKLLKNSPNEKFRSRIERVWYWGLDGKEEREQIVLTSGRGVVFCQIYQYGDDLYVGWDGHVNIGQWVEQAVATGIDRATRKPTVLKAVVSGTQQPSEYDVMDLSCTPLR